MTKLNTRKNKKKKIIKINEGLKLLSDSFRKDFNSIRINTHNTLTHEIAKLIKSYELIYDNYKILTEAIFKNGSRADIFVPEKKWIFEILHTETEKMAIKKIKKYPTTCSVFFYKADEVINNATDTL